MEKNDNFIGNITDINDDGDGVLKQNGEVVFVPNTWIDEEVEGVIINTKSKFAIGKATKILSPSKKRVDPPCKFSTMCGGCTLQHILYEEQLLYKKNKLINIFKKFCGIEANVFDPIFANPFRYRNKTALPFDPKTQKVGMFRTNSHSVLPIDDCIITKVWVKPLIECINNFVTKTKVPIFDESTKKGLLKHLVAREINENILITLVINGEVLPSANTLIADLTKLFGNKFGLNINVNKLMNNVILTDKFIHLYGIQTLESTLFDISYPITNGSFMQVNDDVAKLIYTKVLNEISPNEEVVNAYSGAGLLSALISKKAKTVYGIEIIKEATESANLLAKNNNIHNMINICGDCTKELPKLVKNLTDFTMIVDPPRKGISTEVVTAIKNSSPNKIIYISCNPITLARDCKLLLENSDYNIDSLTPFDMFPETAHIETLCILTKHKK